MSGVSGQLADKIYSERGFTSKLLPKRRPNSSNGLMAYAGVQ